MSNDVLHIRPSRNVNRCFSGAVEEVDEALDGVFGGGLREEEIVVVCLLDLGVRGLTLMIDSVN